MSWLFPQNKSPSVTLPVGASKTYSFSTFTHGSLRRSWFIASRNFENFFSFVRSFLRAAIHSFCETTFRFSTPRTVLIFGIIFSLPFIESTFQILAIGCHWFNNATNERVTSGHCAWPVDRHLRCGDICGAVVP